MANPQDLHEWISFEDPDEDRTWLFDVTFLTSSWTCIFGRGCKGVLDEDFTEGYQGCCSYGAHFADDADRTHTLAMAERLTPSQWQYRDVGLRDGLTQLDDEGATITRLVDDACIFLNRPGFDGDGIGCAFHHAAEASGQRHLDLMPEVCWQLPVRRVDETDEHEHVTSVIREWKRRDWGIGDDDFHWWCTDSEGAFVGDRPVYEELADELAAMTSEKVYDLLREHLRQRSTQHGAAVFVPHPVVRKRGDRATGGPG